MYRVIVIGLSTGGIKILAGILEQLPGRFDIPVVIVPGSGLAERSLAGYGFGSSLSRQIRIPENDEPVRKGYIYIAPPNSHLLLRSDRRFSVCQNRSGAGFDSTIDVALESAASAYGPDTIGIILSGHECEGVIGMKAVERVGGLLIVQDPASSQGKNMPLSVIRDVDVDYIVEPEELVLLLSNIIDYNPSIDRRSAFG